MNEVSYHKCRNHNRGASSPFPGCTGYIKVTRKPNRDGELVVIGWHHVKLEEITGENRSRLQAR